MATMSDLQEFAAFADERIRRGGVVSLVDLAAEWEETRETIEAVRQSEADYAAGRTKSVEDAFASVRENLRLS